MFAPGETSKTVTVKVIGDTICEGTESFYVDLTSATGASIVINGAEGYRNNWSVANITNDDVSATPTVGFTSNNMTMTEGNSGNTNANFTVQLSKSSTETVTVNYTTEQKAFGTAKANLDYVPVTGSVVFAPGDTSKVISVQVIGDTIYEGTESFYVDLTSATGASIVINGAEGYRNNWSVANITNDDVFSVVTKTDKGIFGTTSQDVIGGTAAADYIYGKGGSDIITGFSGNDTFVFSKMDAAKFIKDAPQITDFKNGFDMIGLQGLEFGDLRVAQDTCLHSSDTVISLSTGEVLAVLIGINPLAIDVTDFVSMV